MNLIDTHCHIHDPEFAAAYKKPISDMIDEAKQVGVDTFICVGTSAQSSQLAVSFADKHGVYASLALHPHEVAIKTTAQIDAEFADIRALASSSNKRIVAIGECGLDYFYHPDAAVQSAQKVLFKKHIDLALKHDLPMIFHIRDAFDDFFEILDE